MEEKKITEKKATEAGQTPRPKKKVKIRIWLEIVDTPPDNIQKITETHGNSHIEEGRGKGSFGRIIPGAKAIKPGGSRLRNI